MATTSIPGTRPQGSALERFTDATFIRDDTKLFFGDDGNFSIEYDEDGNDVVLTAGADLRLSDTQKLQFGDSGDVSMTWDGTDLALAGADVLMSDTQKIKFSTALQYISSSADAGVISDSIIIAGIPTSDSGVAGALYTLNGSDLHIHPYS